MLDGSGETVGAVGGVCRPPWSRSETRILNVPFSESNAKTHHRDVRSKVFVPDPFFASTRRIELL